MPGAGLNPHEGASAQELVHMPAAPAPNRVGGAAANDRAEPVPLRLERPTASDQVRPRLHKHRLPETTVSDAGTATWRRS
jgi:hypothetical protein